MTLADFLIEVKAGYQKIVITSHQYDNFGTDDISIGHYFACDSYIWDAGDEEAIMQSCPLLPEDWLDREICEINAVVDMDIYKDFFTGKRKNGYGEDTALRPILNICVYEEEGDDDIWTAETIQKPIHTNMEWDYYAELLK